MSRERKYVVSFSGGKDSTAMLLRLVEEKYPIDYILFCDTSIEFPEMYEHIKQVEKYIKISITYLKAEHDFEYYFFQYMPKRKNPELIGCVGMSWAGPRNRWCTSMLKIRVINNFLKELRKKYDVIEYIGIAADETQRIRDKYYPLIDWGMTEEDCLRYCYERGFTWDGLYDVFNRLSCRCCPLQSIDELRKLYTYYSQLWQKLEEWDEHTWRQFRADYSVKELRLSFEFEKEWQSRGLAVNNKRFHLDLRDYIDAV